MSLLFSIRVAAYHLFGKELFIRLTVHVLRERSSIFMCVLLFLSVLRVGCRI